MMQRRFEDNDGKETNNSLFVRTCKRICLVPDNQLIGWREEASLPCLTTCLEAKRLALEATSPYTHLMP